jgi:hypothetical protein
MDNQELSDEKLLRRLYSARVGERQVGDRAACVAPEAILSVILGETEESERLATLDHVMSCPACHQEYEYLTAVEEAGAETERAAERRTTTWRRILPLAMAASVVLAIGGLVLRDQVRSWTDGAATLPRADALEPGVTDRWWVRTLEEGTAEPAASPIERFRAAGP